MATINKKNLKNTASHPGFAKRSKDSDIEEVIDVTDVQEFLRKDWEELVELNPEYLQPEILFKKLIRGRLIRECGAHIGETKTAKHQYFIDRIRRESIFREEYGLLIERRRRSRGCGCSWIRIQTTTDQLKLEKRLLVDEKVSLLGEIEVYKGLLNIN